MATLNATTDWGRPATGAALATTWRQDRSRMSWGAVLAGAVVAVATTVALSLLGVALGAGAIRPLDANSSDLANYGTGAGIWEIINLAISMVLGGYVAARLSGTHSQLDGELHGITMWGVAVLLSSVLFAQALSGVLGIVGQAPSVVSGMIGGTGAASPDVSTGASASSVIDRFVGYLGSSGDPTTMSRDQINAEITSLIGTSLVNGAISDADRSRLISLTSADYGITREEAARRVSRMENRVKASLTQAEQKARAAADTVARGAAIGSRAVFTALVVGLLAALVGAWLGTRHKRVLHAEERSTEYGAHVPVVSDYAPAHALATGYAPAHAMAGGGYETGRPVGVSVYDDAGHLVVQYLRGVAFPVSKQDLVRMARSSNAGTGLLNAIERLGEGRYANAQEVLGALGMSE